MSTLIDLSIYKEAVYYSDNCNRLSMRLGQGNANVTSAEIYDMFLRSPVSLKRARDNSLFGERRAKKNNTPKLAATNRNP